MRRDDDPVIIGEIVRVHGLQGEVLVHPLSDVPNRYAELAGALLIEPDGSSAYVEVESVRPFEPEFLVKFRGIDDRDQAQTRLVGRTLGIERAAVPPAGEAENYHFELLGLDVVRSDGRRLGVLESIVETGAADVYVVRGPGGEVLIPATHEVIAEVDVAAGKMVVRPLPGLFDVLTNDDDDDDVVADNDDGNDSANGGADGRP